jgi:hypothetical protein
MRIIHILKKFSDSYGIRRFIVLGTLNPGHTAMSTLIRFSILSYQLRLVFPSYLFSMMSRLNVRWKSYLPHSYYTSLLNLYLYYELYFTQWNFELTPKQISRRFISVLSSITSLKGRFHWDLLGYISCYQPFYLSWLNYDNKIHSLLGEDCKLWMFWVCGYFMH